MLLSVVQYLDKALFMTDWLRMPVSRSINNDTPIGLPIIVSWRKRSESYRTRRMFQLKCRRSAVRPLGKPPAASASADRVRCRHSEHFYRKRDGQRRCRDQHTNCGDAHAACSRS